MLQQHDINNLLAAFVASQAHDPVETVQTRLSEIKQYDFAQPESLPSEFLRALDNINALFARAMAGMFSGFLSLGVSVEPLSVDQMTYRQFCASVPELTTIGTFTLEPLEGTALLELNPHLAWFFIDKGLGGQGEIIVRPREFTPLEKGLLDELVFRRVIRELGRAWKNLVPMRPALREVLTNATMARIAQPDDRMVVCSFGINVGDITGMCSYSIPISCLDFERLLNAENDWDDDPREIDNELEYLQVVTNLREVPVLLQACLPEIHIPVGELASLREGDVITLDSRLDDPVVVCVASLPRFQAQPVTVRDVVSIEVLEKLMEVYHG